MIPAVQNYFFRSASDVVRVLPPALLAALVITALYIVWVEYGEGWIKSKWH